MAEIELQKKKKLVVEIPVLQEAITKEYAALRASLRAIPSKVSPLCVGLDVDEIESNISRMIDESLENLAYDER